MHGKIFIPKIAYVHEQLSMQVLIIKIKLQISELIINRVKMDFLVAVVFKCFIFL